MLMLIVVKYKLIKVLEIGHRKAPDLLTSILASVLIPCNF
jgi:hypothetical protein